MSRIPQINITTAPLTASCRWAAAGALVCAAAFLGLLGLLHLLKPELDPSWHFISEYQIGRYGWLMHVAFFLLFVSSSLLLVAVQSQVRTYGGYFGLLLLVVSAIGFALAAVFASDPLTATQASTSGTIHTTAALLGGNVSGAAYFLGWSLARNRAWSSARWSLLWITGVAIAGNIAALWMQGLITQAHAKFGPQVLVGWPNRMLIICYAGWMIGLAWCIVRQRPPADSHSHEGSA